MCPQCTSVQRLRRAREKAERDKQKQEQIEREVRSGNLNYGLKPKPFMTWNDYKRYSPKATFQHYMNEKSKCQSRPLDLDIPDFGIATCDEDCILFREQLAGLKPRIRGFFGFHHQTCRLCRTYCGQFKEEFQTYKGVNLWYHQNYCHVPCNSK